MLLGHAMMRAADVERDVNGVRAALRQFQQTVAIAEEARRRDPALPDLAGRYSQYVGYALGLLGDFTGDPTYYEQALVAHRRSAEASEANYKADPNSRNKRDFADGLCELGWCQRLCNRLDEAVATLSRALTVIEEVSAAHADSQETRLEVATIAFRLGAAESAAGRLRDAHAHLLQARSLIVLPDRPAPTDRETVVLAARIYESLAVVLTAQRQPAAAVDALAEAVSLVQQGSSVPA
jgi:tetratricopeptide (TPR) repeat protein